MESNTEVILEVLAPIGEERPKRKPLASRPDTLDGKKIGLVWNNKPNGDVFLAGVERWVKERHPSAETLGRPISTCCAELPEGELERIAKDIDVAVFALGD